MIPANTKKMATDIAAGYVNISPNQLKGATAPQIKTLLSSMAMVTRGLRAEKISLEEIMELKKRNMKLTRMNTAEMIIRAWCKKRRIPI